MATPRLTIYLDTTNGTGFNRFGHMWIRLTDSNGITRHFGFYPGGKDIGDTALKDTIGYGRNGVVLEAVDAPRVINNSPRVSAFTFEITQAQYDSVLMTSRNFSGTKYSALDYQCIEWVETVLQSVGFQFNVTWWQSAGMGALFNDYSIIRTQITDGLNRYGNFAQSAYNNVPNMGLDEFNNWWGWMNGVWDQMVYICGPVGCYGGYGDPLVIDFTGNGISVEENKNGVKFDLLNDGSSDRFAWPDRGTGFLVLDINGNGKIDSGAELFGNATKLPIGENAIHGYHAISQYDTNNDFLISELDPAYHSIQVWMDNNGNGKSEAKELFHLNEMGISSISLENEYVYENKGLVAIYYSSDVNMYDGTTVKMYDIYLKNVSHPEKKRSPPSQKAFDDHKKLTCTKAAVLCDLKTGNLYYSDPVYRSSFTSNQESLSLELTWLPYFVETASDIHIPM